MTEPTPQTQARSRAANRRPSLQATVLNVAVVAAVAAALIWSLLFVDLLHRRSDVAAAPSPPSTGQTATPNQDQPAQAPAPVTTRSS